jgi:DNA-binding NarL/FixJ family response regulator
VLLATPNTALFDRIGALLAARPEVRFIPQRVDDGRVVAAVRHERPDVLLVDGASFGHRGVRFIHRVAALELPTRTRTLLLHSEPTEFRLAHVLQCGGSGCLSSNCGAFDLIRAIQVVHQGELWASRKALADAIRELRVPLGAVSTQESELALSRREREIVEWMRKGMTNKEIGRVLGISDMTVKTHAHNIFHKLEVSGRRLLAVVPLLQQ